MTEPDDPFGDEPTDGIPRDRWDRPMLVPRSGPEAAAQTAGGEAKRVPYTRASTLASFIENDTHIQRWKMRYLARGYGQNEDLAALAGVETYSTGFGMPDRDRENSASGKRLDELNDRVLDRMRISEKADYGTVVHVATEPGFEGYVPDRADADVESFKAIVTSHGIKIVGTELFTANDVTMSAGTFDHLMWVPGYGFVITDKKTSAKVDGPHFAIQLAGYANGELYLPDDTRAPLESLTGGEAINRDVGLIFWIKNGVTEIHEVDLKLGWKGAQIAAAARDYNKAKHPGRVDGNIALAAMQYRAGMLEQVAGATDRATIEGLWKVNSHLWTDDHTKAATKRIAELA